MSNSSEGTGIAFLFVVVTIGSWLGSGYMAWNWIEPHSFGSTLVFLFVWPLCGYLVDTVLAFVIATIVALFNK
ncbi:MAG: hypothetical protein COZ18_08465 [Flexibacter sp. CG_4_10_14_3_um_filter_32_15]|nr:MAG: hypothetical protein COZ18_08465 [Flexibacter sp. CG_4_10_14_3_um_filter_32_15]